MLLVAEMALPLTRLSIINIFNESVTWDRIRGWGRYRNMVKWSMTYPYYVFRYFYADRLLYWCKNDFEPSFKSKHTRHYSFIPAPMSP